MPLRQISPNAWPRHCHLPHGAREANPGLRLSRSGGRLIACCEFFTRAGTSESHISTLSLGAKRFGDESVGHVRRSGEAAGCMNGFVTDGSKARALEVWWPA